MHPRWSPTRVSNVTRPTGRGGQFTPQNVQHGMGQSKSSRRRRRKRKNKGADAQQGAQPGGDQARPVHSLHPGFGARRSHRTSRPAAASNRTAPRRRQTLEEKIPRPRPSTLAGEPRQRRQWQQRRLQQQRRRISRSRHPSARQQQRRLQAQRRQAATARPPQLRRPHGSQLSRRQRQLRRYATIHHRIRQRQLRPQQRPWRGRGYQSDSQPIDYSQGRPIPIPENAPTKIFFFIEDLFFIAKIQETARKLGVKVAFVKNEKDAIAALTAGEEDDLPGLIVFDLNNANAKPLTLIPKLKAKLKRNTSIVGFLSHLQGDLKAKAVEAGCDTVMPRAAFSQNLPNLLRRYGMEEEEELNYNQ